MPSFPYCVVDVFTSVRFGGNPLAVISDARGMSAEDMQSIAIEFGFSETTFVLPASDANNTAQVRIFTPTDEIPFAGHPNVGTAFVLGQAGEVFGRKTGRELRFEERAGLVEVALRERDGVVCGATIQAPRALEICKQIDAATVAACLGVAESDVIQTTHQPVMASVGLPFVIVEVRTDVLAASRPRKEAFVAANEKYPHPDDRFSVFAYARHSADYAALECRMFAPLSNIEEDPATGSASAALGALLASLDPRADADIDILIRQGVQMGRPSTIEVAVTKRAGAVTSVRISGDCVKVMEGRISL